jgi:uncharacterized protein (TIGR02001 family)
VRLLTKLLVALLAVAGAAHAQPTATGVSGYVTVASAYWRHGLAQRDGPTLALAVDYEHQSGFFAYGRATGVEYGSYGPYGSYGDSRDVEASAHAGFQRRRPGWSWTASVGRYLYPDTGGAYDYDEASFGVGWRDRVFYSVAVSGDYYGRPSSALAQEVSFAFPLRGDFEVGAALGSFDLGNSGVDYTHWNVGVSKLIGRFALDLRRYDTNHDSRGWLGDPYAERYVLSASYAMRSRRSAR